MKKRVLSTLLVLCLVLGLLPGVAWAAEPTSGSCGDNVTWTLDSKGTLTISGNGDMKDFAGYSLVPWYSIRHSIQKIVIEDGVTSIGRRSFIDCSVAKSISIADSVARIGTAAFNNCRLVESILIPSKVTSIEDGQFVSCTSLSQLTVAPDNPAYVCEDGALFDKNKTTLISCLKNRPETSYQIPASVTRIADRAFNSCENLTSIIIPDGVTTIEEFTFSSCTNLESVMFPNSITEIGNSVFFLCENLKDIYYKGTKEQWDKIAIHSSVNTSLQNVNIHYESSDLTPDTAPIVSLIPSNSIVQGTAITIKWGAVSDADRYYVNVINKTANTYYYKDYITYDTQIVLGPLGLPAGEYEVYVQADYTGKLGPESKHLSFTVTPISGYDLEISLDSTSANVPLGNNYQIGAHVTPADAAVTWYSNNKEVALVDEKGVVTGLKIGKATITAVAMNDFNEKMATCEVKVVPQVLVGPDQIEFENIGDQVTLITTVTPETASITWESSNPNVATVDQNGTVTTTGHGKAIITASATVTAGKDNYTGEAVCEVMVGPDINDPIVFIEQDTNKTCTAASAAMMLRRRALLDGLSNWEFITDAAVRKVAWTPGKGLDGEFSCWGMAVSTQGLKSTGYITTADKSALFVSLLSTHPEGIVVYNHSKPHAILLTDYDPSAGTFYCADPANPKGRMPLISSTIPGTTQDSIIGNINQIWFISSNLNKKTISASNIATHCPVEMRVSISGNILDSTGVTGTISNEYASMTVAGSGQDRSVEVSVTGPYDFGNGLDIELLGTDTGTMTFTVEHQYTDGSTDTQTFQNVPVTSSTSGTANINPQSTVILTLVDTKNPVEKEYWIANPGETVTAPSEEETVPSPSYPDIPWIPSTPSRPTTPTKPSTPSTTTPVTPPAETKPEEPTPETPPNTPAVTLPFTDVSPADWFYPSVQYVYEKGLMTGDGSPTIFNPSGSMTRAMVWTVLGRIAGADVSGSGSEWFAKAQAWAVAEGVSDGSNPNGGVARQELVTMLWRSAGSPTAAADLSGFSDGGDVAGWAGTAMQWAVSNAVLSGDNGALKPAAPASRAEVAAILTRFCQYRAA